MFYRFTLLIILLFAAACQGSNSEESNVITMTQPQNGAMIFAESLTISGEGQNEFQLELIDTEDNVITSASVQPTEGNWSVELVHGYTGEPTEVIIRAVRGEEITSLASILLSDISQRQDGLFGMIIIPADGVEVGGDAFLSEGRVSGTDNITVELQGDGGIVIHEQTLELNNPNLINEVPWQAEIAVGEYTGQAILRIYTTDASGEEVTLDTARFTVLMAAG